MADTRVEIPAERTAAGLLPLWFGLLGGHSAWSLQLLVNYLLVTLACPLGPAPFVVFGIAGLEFLMVLVTIVAAAIALAATVVSYRAWQSAPAGSQQSPGASAAPGEGITGRSQFMALVGMLLSALFLLTILLVGTSNLYLDPLANPGCLGP
jgi:hypothetical protein